jgi:hypothetical protein
MERLTYRSSWGDYGSAIDWSDEREEITALRNKLGKYEDEDAEWISVAKYGKPKTDGEYEVTAVDSSGKRFVTTDYYSTDESGFIIMEADEYTPVVAWRNLPEPYGGD